MIAMMTAMVSSSFFWVFEQLESICKQKLPFCWHKQWKNSVCCTVMPCKRGLIHSMIVASDFQLEELKLTCLCFCSTFLAKGGFLLSSTTLNTGSKSHWIALQNIGRERVCFCFKPSSDFLKQLDEFAAFCFWWSSSSRAKEVRMLAKTPSRTFIIIRAAASRVCPSAVSFHPALPHGCI